MFQNRNPVRVFLYHCISDGNQLFSKNVGCHFHLILHIMSDKAAFVSGALFCVERYRGNLELLLQQRLPLAENRGLLPSTEPDPKVFRDPRARVRFGLMFNG